MTVLAAQFPAISLRRRIWKAAGLVAAFIFTLVIANGFLPYRRAVTRDMLGHDFLTFYSAGTFARAGQFDRLYDLSAIKAREAAIGHAAGLTVGFGPWWNPPFAAWLFVPFTLLPFNQALAVWWAIGFICLGISMILLARMLPEPRDWRNEGLIPLLVFASGPFWAVAGHGQNTFLTLLLLCITAVLWRRRRAWAAGLVAGLLLYKPQHAVIIAAMLCLSLGWRAAAGFAATAAALILVTIFTMPGVLGNYLHTLPGLLKVMQEQSDYSWDRHVTLKAFWRLLLQGDNAGSMLLATKLLWCISELFVTGILIAMVRGARRDRVIAAAVLASPLLVPFCFDYDLLILALPATLCAADAMAHGTSRRLLGMWIALYLVLEISTQMAHFTRFIAATPAMAAMLVILLP
jgi:alpha-1,2-mannosyltransferase